VVTCHGVAAGDGEAEPLQDVGLPVLGTSMPPSVAQRPGPVAMSPLQRRRLADVQRLRSLAACQLQRHAGGDLEARSDEAGIDSALEAGARVGGEAQLLPGAGDVRGIEIGAFDQDIGGGLGHAECSPPMMPPMSWTAGLVGDHRHRLVERIGLAVQRLDRLAGPRLAAQ
jgi:hypothetical protein